MNIAYPINELSAYVKFYWELSSHNSVNDCLSHRVVPDGLHTIYFYFSNLPEVHGLSTCINSNTFFSGRTTSFYDLEINGAIDLFAITLQPIGAALLFGKPIHESLNHMVSLKDLLGKDIVKLEDEMQSTYDFSSRIAIAESFLLAQLFKNKTPYYINAISASIANLAAENSVKNDSIALSQRQQQRQFKQVMGISIKAFERIIRFQKALHLKGMNPALDMLSLVEKCGYFDQAHMIHDFKKMSGYTPKSYFESYDPYSDYFS